MRVQQVTASTSFMASVAGQVASTNLDSSEKMQLGGMYGVRAFPEGEASADQGAVLTLEARQLLPLSERVPGQAQLVAFVDAGSVTLNKNPGAKAPTTGSSAAPGWASTGPAPTIFPSRRSMHAHSAVTRPRPRRTNPVVSGFRPSSTSDRSSSTHAGPRLTGRSLTGGTT
ncbi:Heme/hemopexin transporter protein HuxB precursor [Hydrogenophaga sp. T4]|nr:Heme/hemopexin transporter protein HuxB precursor [Hydrogenophaga sp. T4]